MKEFIFINWKELISLILIFLTLLVSLFRKKGKADPVNDFIFGAIPKFIEITESQLGSGHGALKKSVVMGLVTKHYKRLTGLELPVESDIYSQYADFVELVLSTPQKKGKK